MNKLRRMCWDFLLSYLMSKDNSDIAKAEIIKKLFNIKRPVECIQLIIKAQDKEVTQIFDIRYRREDYPELPVWRIQVFERDNFTCVECGSKKNLQAHHIKRWAEYPELRFDINNGTTLCKRCHSKTEGYMRKYNGIQAG